MNSKTIFRFVEPYSVDVTDRFYWTVSTVSAWISSRDPP